ncbi:CHAP domain-containing protein [bacterium]|nr:CHAP domain-containing protein [bacterium]
MAFYNFFVNFNINFAQPRFGVNFGCFSTPNFFPTMPFFPQYNNISLFNGLPFLQQYTNPSFINPPSIFNSQINFQPQYNNNCPYFSNTTNYLGNTSYAPNFDTFSYTTNVQASCSISQNHSSKNTFLKEYNKNRGEKLANIALKNSVGWTEYCAKYVKKAIKEAGLGDCGAGHAYQMSNILANNPNFKKLSSNNVNVKELPAGCVLVYDKGAQGYSKEYGHVEITTGDGRGVSDGITQNLRKPSAIFIPV